MLLLAILKVTKLCHSLISIIDNVYVIAMDTVGERNNAVGETKRE